MSDNKGIPKDRVVLVIASSNPQSSNLDLFNIMRERVKGVEIIMQDMSVSIIKAGQAGMALSAAFKKLSPALFENLYDLDINRDFSGLEKITLDSLCKYDPGFNYKCFDESGIITKKQWKKLAKKHDKKYPKEKTQKEIWCNKWDHRIKRK